MVIELLRLSEKHNNLIIYLTWILLTKFHLMSDSLNKLLLLCSFLIL